jgi:hypothetical protein
MPLSDVNADKILVKARIVRAESIQVIVARVIMWPRWHGKNLSFDFVMAKLQKTGVVHLAPSAGNRNAAVRRRQGTRAQRSPSTLNFPQVFVKRVPVLAHPICLTGDTRLGYRGGCISQGY